MSRYVGIDPSTKTGLVVLDEAVELWEAIEIDTGLNGRSPTSIEMKRLVVIIISYVLPGDEVAIEGFGFSSQSVFLLGGIGWLLRVALDDMGVRYKDIAPSQLKKFTGEGGNAAKELVAVGVYKRWGFQSKSNNITDAFVLAQIVRALHEPVHLIALQKEVIKQIQSPAAAKAKGKPKIKKRKVV